MRTIGSPDVIVLTLIQSEITVFNTFLLLRTNYLIEVGDDGSSYGLCRSVVVGRKKIEEEKRNEEEDGSMMEG